MPALSSFTYWSDRHHVDWREIGRLLPFTLLGVLVGLFAFQRLDPTTLTKAFGVFGNKHIDGKPLLNVFQLGLAQRDHCAHLQLGGDIAIDHVRDADTIRLGQSLEPGGDIDAITKHIARLPK